MIKKSLVVMSGGQDSATCLGVAIDKSETVSAVSFYYGQKHSKELDMAAYICGNYNVNHKIVDVSNIAQMFQSSALVNHGDTAQKHEYLKDLPASFVPVRNALFLTIAYGIAMETGCEAIYTGVCQTDYSGYPDCRDHFIKSLNNALDVGYQSEIQIMTPLMFLDKADTFKLAEDKSMLETIIRDTLTCYDGIEKDNEWGLGCGECPACVLRKNGYEQYLERYHGGV